MEKKQKAKETYSKYYEEHLEERRKYFREYQKKNRKTMSNYAINYYHNKPETEFKKLCKLVYLYNPKETRSGRVRSNHICKCIGVCRGGTFHMPPPIRI